MDAVLRELDVIEVVPGFSPEKRAILVVADAEIDVAVLLERAAELELEHLLRVDGVGVGAT